MFDRVEVKNMITCAIAPDKMSVKLILKQDHPQRNLLTKEHILQELKRLGVVYGIEEELIEGAVEFYKEYGEEEEIVVAEGTEQKPGKPGFIETYFKKPDPHFTVRKDGSIDYHEVTILIPVEKGQPLCRIKQPIPGEDGVDVLGKIIKTREYQEVKLPTIQYAEIDSHDENMLVSQIDGCVHFINNRMVLSKNLVIHGDVDRTTGNITYDGPVIITGNVRSGYEIHASDDIEIYGHIEDVTIESPGNINIKSGFIGSGKGVVTSGGTVMVDYVKNQHISAKGDIYILKNAENSHLSSMKKIYVAGSDLGISGGRAFATQGMELSCLGRATEKTEIQLGSESEIKETIDTIEKEITLINKKSLVLDKQIDEIERIKHQGTGKLGAVIQTLERIMELKSSIDAKIEQLKSKRSTIIKQEQICWKPVLRVYGQVNPGSILFFNNYKRVITEPMCRKVFTLEKGAIKDSYLIG